MLQELSGFKHINQEVIDMCYSSVCQLFNLTGDKDIVIEEVKCGLSKIFALID